MAPNQRNNGEQTATRMQPLALGDLCKDAISGYKGIVIARTQWLHGDNRVILQSQELHREKGTPVEAVQFMEDQVELLTPNAFNETAIAQSRSQANSGRANANPNAADFGVGAGAGR